MSALFSNAYIISARRSALGRLGGLHRHRRIEELTTPILAAALADAGVEARDVDELILGNASQGGNPARLLALSSGLSDSCGTCTIDRQCASGLEAVISAVRLIALGEARIVATGGAESLSTAPWRVARPRSLHQTPRFVDVDAALSNDDGESELIAASETLARRLGIDRARQDAYALQTRLRAAAAYDAERFVGEIVPLRLGAGEARDEGIHELLDADEIAELPAYEEAGGTVSPGNVSTLHDGAAMSIVVNEDVYQGLGRPPALRLLASCSVGALADAGASAPVTAAQRLLERLGGGGRNDIRVIELSEASAAQAVAFSDALQIDGSLLNPDGGAVARGHPYGASGAVLVVRLFTQLVRHRRDAAADARSDADANGVASSAGVGFAATGALGGVGVAAAFEIAV